MFTNKPEGRSCLGEAHLGHPFTPPSAHRAVGHVSHRAGSRIAVSDLFGKIISTLKFHTRTYLLLLCWLSLAHLFTGDFFSSVLCLLQVMASLLGALDVLLMVLRKPRAAGSRLPHSKHSFTVFENISNHPLQNSNEYS